MLQLHTVVPTLGRPRRLTSLFSAVRSTLTALPESSGVTVVVDGSPSTLDVIKNLERHSKRLQVISTGSHVGKPAACNIGFATREADWISVLDDDDRLTPFFSRLLQHATSTNSQTPIVFGDAQLSRHVSWQSEPIYERQSCEGYQPIRLLSYNYIYQPCFLVRYDAFRGVGGYRESLPILEDWDLLRRLSLRYDFTHLPIPVATVTIDPTTDSRSSSLNSQPQTYDDSLSSILTAQLPSAPLIPLTVIKLTTGPYLRNNLSLARTLRVPHWLSLPESHYDNVCATSWSLRSLTNSRLERALDNLAGPHARVTWSGNRQHTLDDKYDILDTLRSRRQPTKT